MTRTGPELSRDVESEMDSLDVLLVGGSNVNRFVLREFHLRAP
jgi:hypothetical protein